VLAVCDGMLLTNRILTKHSRRSAAAQYTRQWTVFWISSLDENSRNRNNSVTIVH